MKIIRVNYMKGEARFVVDEVKDTTFVIDLKKFTTEEDIVNELKNLIALSTDNTEELYNNLNLKSLEGSNI